MQPEPTLTLHPPRAAPQEGPSCPQAPLCQEELEDVKDWVYLRWATGDAGVICVCDLWDIHRWKESVCDLAPCPQAAPPPPGVSSGMHAEGVARASAPAPMPERACVQSGQPAQMRC